MTRRILAVMVLAILVMYAGSAMAQTPVTEQQPLARPQTTRPLTEPAPHPVGKGQPMPPAALGKWWKDSAIVNELQLTPEQISQLEKSFFDHRLKLITLNAALQVAETQLEALLDADRPEEAKVVAQIDQVTQARGNLEKQNALMMLGVRRVLSVEQWKKLQEMQHRHIEVMPMKRPARMERMPERHPTPAPQRPPEE